MATKFGNAINSTALSSVANGTDGQLLIAATNNPAAFNTLISTTLSQQPTANNLTVNVIRLATGGNGWTSGATTGSVSANSAYIVTAAAQTLTLPAVTTQGDIFYIFTQGSGTAVIDYSTNIRNGAFYFNGTAAGSNPTLAANSACIIVATQTGATNPVYQVISVNGTLS